MKSQTKNVKEKIQVAILEGHQCAIDGYRYRFGSTPDIEIVAIIRFGNQLLSTLAAHNIDVIIIGFNVKNDESDQDIFPFWQMIPEIKKANPNISMLVLTEHKTPMLIKKAIDSGVNGYLFKDDHIAFKRLGSIIRSITAGGTFLSKSANEVLSQIANDTLKLTPREIETLSICAENPNITTAALAQNLNLAHSTVRNMLSGTYNRLGVNNRAAAVLKACNMGLISPREKSFNNLPEFGI